MAAARAGYVTPPLRSPGDEIEVDGASSESETDELTSQELIARIVKAWQNEKLSPELLTPIEGEIEVLREELVKMESNMRKLLPTDIRFSIHKMELKRLRYVLTSYLRTRILKIQEYACFYWRRLESLGPHDLPFMMKDEIEFTRDYILNSDDVIRTVAVNNMPVNFQPFDQHMRLRLRKPPNVDRFVFFRSNTTKQIELLDGNKIKEKDPVIIQNGSQYVMRYRPLRDLLLKDEISLI